MILNSHLTTRAECSQPIYLQYTGWNKSRSCWISLTAHGSLTFSSDSGCLLRGPDQPGLRGLAKCAKQEPQGRQTPLTELRKQLTSCKHRHAVTAKGRGKRKSIFPSLHYRDGSYMLDWNRKMESYCDRDYFHAELLALYGLLARTSTVSASPSIL